MDRVTGTDAAEGGTLLPPFQEILMPGSGCWSRTRPALSLNMNGELVEHTPARFAVAAGALRGLVPHASPTAA